MRYSRAVIGGLTLIAVYFVSAQYAYKAGVKSVLKKSIPEGVPRFVARFAPLCYLHHEEQYFPSDLQAHIDNTWPEVDFQIVPNAPYPLKLDNLDLLNTFGDVYLTSRDDITKNPTWLHGVKPDSTGRTRDAISCAVIIHDRGNGTVDAFYMYFYSYNWGGQVLDYQLGNHVGDWEHNMIRFKDGKPKWIWYSQHGNGENFAYSVVHKSDKRPINYVGNGTHANYATPGTHDQTPPDLGLPAGLILDYTDGPDQGGIVWDPLCSAYYYNYTNIGGTPTFTPLDTRTPTSWLNFLGMWGDQRYPESDPRQQLIYGGVVAKYESGPTGPVHKQLDRVEVCPQNGHECIYRQALAP